jgi:hypothetical protein
LDFRSDRPLDAEAACDPREGGQPGRAESETIAASRGDCISSPLLLPLVAGRVVPLGLAKRRLQAS